MERKVLSLVEKVTLFPNDYTAMARIDTGATSSSIDASLAEKLGYTPLEKSKVVKSALGINKRHLVKIKLKIKDLLLEEEFTLAERSHMTYTILIGQNILKRGNFLIDPNKEIEK